MSKTSTIRRSTDDDVAVILTLDHPNQTTTTMNAGHTPSIKQTVERLEAEKDGIIGVIISSGQKTFFAGGDMHDLKRATKDNSEEIARFVHDNKAVLRRLETL